MSRSRRRVGKLRHTGCHTEDGTCQRGNNRCFQSSIKCAEHPSHEPNRKLLCPGGSMYTTKVTTWLLERTTEIFRDSTAINRALFGPSSLSSGGCKGSRPGLSRGSRWNANYRPSQRTRAKSAIATKLEMTERFCVWKER